MHPEIRHIITHHMSEGCCEFEEEMDHTLAPVPSCANEFITCQLKYLILMSVRGSHSNADSCDCQSPVIKVLKFLQQTNEASGLSKLVTVQKWLLVFARGQIPRST